MFSVEAGMYKGTLERPPYTTVVDRIILPTKGGIIAASGKFGIWSFNENVYTTWEKAPKFNYGSIG